MKLLRVPRGLPAMKLLRVLTLVVAAVVGSAMCAYALVDMFVSIRTKM